MSEKNIWPLDYKILINSTIGSRFYFPIKNNYVIWQQNWVCLDCMENIQKGKKLECQLLEIIENVNFFIDKKNILKVHSMLCKGQTIFCRSSYEYSQFFSRSTHERLYTEIFLTETIRVYFEQWRFSIKSSDIIPS